jgi:hypothetical protein
MLDILSVFLYAPKRVSAKPGELEDNVIALRRDTFINVRLLSDSYFANNILQYAPLDEGLKSQIVVS